MVRTEGATAHSVVTSTDDAENVHAFHDELATGTDYPVLEIVVVTDSALAGVIHRLELWLLLAPDAPEIATSRPGLPTQP